MFNRDLHNLQLTNNYLPIINEEVTRRLRLAQNLQIEIEDWNQTSLPDDAVK